MTRFVPQMILLAWCAVAYTLWQLNIYPFTDPLFVYEGYTLHFFVAVAYTTLQVTLIQLLQLHFRQLHVSYTAHSLIATVVLTIAEFFQFYLPSHHVQWQDMLAQIIGILLVTIFLQDWKQDTHTP